MLKSMNPEKLSGILLIVAALLALILDNSPLAWLYDSLLSTPVIIQIGELAIDKPLLLWINDGLMAVFFFLIGLEIKKEILGGELSNMKKASLPLIAAIGGIIVPASIYVALNYQDQFALSGWAVPVATDIAFALGILALLGDRIPKELKILLLSLAIIDDVAAIVIIAVFYTQGLSLMALGLASIGLISALAMNKFGVKKVAPYILIGIFMWVCVLKSGVHATLAGVVLAFCIPMRTDNPKECPVKELEHALHPWVYFMIMPLFAFANAGLYLGDFTFETLLNPVPLGIIGGLFIGKQLGVFSFIWLGAKLKLCEKPNTVSWPHIYGLALLTGIGFTMSLFIGTLAYGNDPIIAQVRLGILVASLLSALCGFLVLKWAKDPKR
ncbi:MAG: Na+/H+ antiporter NhaA [Alphaproteobacteria bacterium]|nr:Na+/H+ antiporter NhaA [Alphaproteobacteria bacterium]